MDFGELLDYAKKNDKPSKEVRCYRTSFAPPKKEQKSKSLSANIQKFLARKEEEERQKTIDADRKRDELLALRAQDSKANKRVRAMLKSTKAANKAVIDDARDDVNTAVTMAGPSQPDEDDYGYVSQEASAFYNKLMDKYVSTPSEDPKFSKKNHTVKDLVSTKDRVRLALLKEEEEESMPHKRKRRKPKEDAKDEDDNICYDAPDRDVSGKEPRSSYKETSHERSEPEVKKKRPPAPPPINFADLLKVAAQKQFEPIKIEKKDPRDEDERPMTKKQKEEYLREKQHRLKKEEMARMAAAKPKEKSHKNASQPQVLEEPRNSSSAKFPSIPRIPKLNGAKSAPESNSRMSGNDASQQMRKRESHQISSREEVQARQHPPDRPISSSRPSETGRSINNNRSSEVGRSINNNRPIPSAGEPDSRYNEVRRNSLQQSSKVWDSYQDAKLSPAQCAPSLKEKKTVVEEKKLYREIPRPMAKEERRLPNTPSKYVNEDERSHMKPPSKPVIKEERSLNSASQKPVIRDDRKQLGNQTKHYIKEARSNSPESFRVPSEKSMISGKQVKPIGSANRSKGDYPRHGDGGSLKMSSIPPRRVEEKPYKGSPTLSSGNSLLKDRLTGPNNLSQSSKPSPASHPQAKKEVRTAPSAQRQGNPGVPVKQPLPSDKSNKAAHKPQPADSQGSSKDVPRGPPHSSRDVPRGPPSSSRDVPRGPPPPSRDVTRGPPPPSRDVPRGPPSSRDVTRGPPPSRYVTRGPPPSSRDATRAPLPPERRHEPVGRGEVRRPMTQDRGPPGGRFLPANRPRPQGMKKSAKRRIESDDEYDSELDDFIDDGPEEDEDYSKYIKEIFGYDKSRYSYVNEEDDEECMESNFAQQMKEEFVSTKLGIMEDLEDIKNEQMEKKRKKAFMMKKRKM